MGPTQDTTARIKCFSSHGGGFSGRKRKEEKKRKPEGIAFRAPEIELGNLADDLTWPEGEEPGGGTSAK